MAQLNRVVFHPRFHLTCILVLSCFFAISLGSSSDTVKVLDALFAQANNDITDTPLFLVYETFEDIRNTDVPIITN
eukprot:m.6701 g.6701  ORF g.6701 m.6701 type:complete len:76 (-) comp5347_c0_seq1:755-982(-)